MFFRFNVRQSILSLSFLATELVTNTTTKTLLITEKNEWELDKNYLIFIIFSEKKKKINEYFLHFLFYSFCEL